MRKKEKTSIHPYVLAGTGLTFREFLKGFARLTGCSVHSVSILDSTNDTKEECSNWRMPYSKLSEDNLKEEEKCVSVDASLFGLPVWFIYVAGVILVSLPGVTDLTDEFEDMLVEDMMRQSVLEAKTQLAVIQQEADFGVSPRSDSTEL